ncbi:polymorphic toxin-type HINT domain-containing protein [Streptomyces sp. ID05-26A]|nr:polymorphic toxin-type HINT domain-containing protein [Streptomyces sp. ID05-26A]
MLRKRVLLLVVLMLVGWLGPAASQLMPPLFDDYEELIEAMELAPDQHWDRSPESLAKAKALLANVSTSAQNRKAESEQLKFPPLDFGSDNAAGNGVTASVHGPQAAGFDPKTSRELPGERKENERSYLNTDGTVTTEISREALNYRKADGTMAPIDTALVRDGSGWRNAADATDMRFAGTASATGTVRLAFDDSHKLGYGIADSAPVKAEATGGTLTYSGVRPEADLRFDVRPGALKETIVLRSPSAPRSWLFPLQLENLRAEVVDGRVALFDEKNAERVRFPRGFMVDSKVNPDSGEAPRSEGVRYEIVKHGNGVALKVELDHAWLDDKARQYPVLVDPTVEPVNPSVAMNAQDGFDDTTGGELKAGSVEGTTSAVYLKFPGIENSMRNHKIFNAHLAVANIHSYSCKPRPVTVHEVTENWPRATKGYPGASFGPALAESWFALGRAGCDADWQIINLGDAGRGVVQKWVDHEKPNYGLTLRAPTNDVYAWKKFASGRQGTQGAAPALYITHSPYNVSYEFTRSRPEPPITRTTAGKVKLTAKNLGSATWTKTGYGLGYRIFNKKDGSRVSEVETAANLPEDVPRGGSVALEPEIQKLNPGEYIIDFTIVHRGVKFLVDDMMPALRLVLEVYEQPPKIVDMTPPNGYPSPVLSPTLWARAVDIAPPPGASLTYNFQVCRKDKDNKDTGCFDSGYQPSQSWTVPKDKLRWSETYFWRVTAFNGTIHSTPSDQAALQTVVPQPEITSHLATAPYSGATPDFDPQTGNYFSSAVDVTVATAGPALGVVRTYNSLDPRNELAFGTGWSSMYDMRAVPDDDGSGNVVVTYTDGQQARFGLNADGSFSPPAGRTAAFRKDLATGGWSLQDKAGSAYAFGTDGKLARIVDNQRREVLLAYEGGKVKTARSATSGRTLTFAWNGAHISSVTTDEIGGKRLTWNYTYSGDKLTKVCDPQDRCTGYDYGQGSHYRSSVVDSKPDSYWRLNEAAGDVAASQIARHIGKDNGKAVNVGRAAQGPLTGSGTGATTFNGTSSVVTLPKDTAVKSLNMAVELWFRTTASGPLFAHQRKPIGEDSDGAVPALYVGTDGKLRGQFWHGSVAPITTAGPVNDGQWHHVVLSGEIGSQSLYLDGAKVGSLAGTIAPQDVPHTQLGAGYAAGTWPAWGPSPRWFYNGEMAEAAVYLHPLGLPAVRAHWAARSAADQLTKVALPSGRTAASITYDTTRDRVKEFVDANGGTWRLGAPSASGDEKNPLVSVSATDPGNRPHDYGYDSQRSRIVWYASPLGLHAREKDTAVPTPAPTTPAPCTTQPSPPSGEPQWCGGPITSPPKWETGRIEGQGVRTFGYDERGFQNSVVNEVGNKVEYDYDERGNMTSSKSCRTDGDCQTTHTTYFLNAGNSLDPRNDKPIESRDARSSGPADNTYVKKIDYLVTGEESQRTMPDGGTVKHTYTTDSDWAYGGGNAPGGLLATTTDSRGGVTRYTYYRNGDMAEVVQPSGLTNVYEYDVLGRKTKQTQLTADFPDGLVTTYAYDELSRQVEVRSPGVRNAITGVTHTSVSKTSYDADGLKTSIEVSDATGGDRPRKTSFAFDDRGRVAKATDSLGRETTQGYDVYGNVTWKVDPAGTRSEISYTARNQVSAVRVTNWTGDEGTPGGGVLTLEENTYDHAGRLAQRTDAMNRTQLFSYYRDDRLWKTTAIGEEQDIVLQENFYDAAGNVVKQLSGNGLMTTVMEYDATGRVKSSTADPAKVQRRMDYTYNQAGDLVREVRGGLPSNVPFQASAASTRVDYTFDTAGRQTEQKAWVDGQFLTTRRVYDERNLLRSVTDPRGEGFTTEYAYDEMGREVTATSPEVSVEALGAETVRARPTTNKAYNTFDEPTQVRDANGRLTTTSFDDGGRSVRTQLPSYTPPGSSSPITPVLTTEYDELDNVVASKNARDHTIRMRYDQFGRLVERTTPDNAVWRYTYTRNGEELSATTPLGGRVQSTYDEFGRVKTSTQLERYPRPEAFSSTFTHDELGRVVTATAPSGDKVTNQYDTAGQLIRTVDAAGVKVDYGYDQVGRQITVRDGLGRTSSKRFDESGRLTALMDLNPRNQMVRASQFTYDAAGNQTEATDPYGRTTAMTYDAMNRPQTQVEPVTDSSSITTSFGYDATGNRTRYTDGRQHATFYTFNSLGLPESVVEPSTAAHTAASDRTWTVAYDAAGNAVTAKAPGNVVRQRTYDALNRLEKETGAGAESATADREQTYDLAGRIKTVSAPGSVNTFEYNDRNALLSATGPSGDSSFSYDENGRVVQRTDAAGTSNYTYNRGRLMSVQDGVTNGVQLLGYDDSGTVDKVSYSSGHTRALTFDDLGRPVKDSLKTTAGVEVTSIGYEFDLVGNMTAKTTTGTAGSSVNKYGYDYTGRMTSWTSGSKTVAYEWDASGNRTRAGDKVATYDERNRLLSDGDYTYKWTARGTMKSRTSSGFEEKFGFDAFDRKVSQDSTQFAYDGLDRLVSRNTKKFAYSGGGDVLASDGSASYSRGPSGELMSLQENGAKRITISDLHGDVIGGIDPANGTAGLADSAAFDPFGKVLGVTGSKRSVGYQGAWTDPDSGQVDMGARWYDPSTGGFASRDSVRASGGDSVLYNGYTYAGGSPLSATDPDGHWPDWLDKAASAVGRAASSAGSWANRNVVQPVVNTAKSVGNWVSSTVSAGVGWVKQTFNQAVNYATQFANTVKNWAKDTWNKVSPALKAGWNKITSMASAGWNKIAAGFNDAKNWASNKLAPIINSVTSAWNFVHDNIVEPMSDMTRRYIIEPVMDTKRLIISGIKSAPAAIVSAVTDLSFDEAQQQIDAAWNAALVAVPQLQYAVDYYKGVGEFLDEASDLLINGAIRTMFDPIGYFMDQVEGGMGMLSSPIDSLKSIVNWDTWAESPAKGLGKTLPDVVLAIVSGGSAGAGRAVGKGVAKEIAEGAAEGGAKRSLRQKIDDCNSFIAGTMVLMADGSRRPIEDVAVGDLVLATDPTTGVTEAKPVTDVIVGDGEKNLVALSVRGSAASSAVVATDGHPFYVDSRKTWLLASEVQAGDSLRTDDGAIVAVIATRAWTEERPVYNLTVDGIHTFYVSAAGQDFLVHNCEEELRPGYTSSPALKGDPYHPDSVAARSDKNVSHYVTHKEMAQQLGFTRRMNSGQFRDETGGGNSHRQDVYHHAKDDLYISRDHTEHKTVGWKLFNRRGERIGTYNYDLSVRVGK